MAQKDAADKNTENIFYKIAARFGGVLVTKAPAIFEALYKTGDQLMNPMDNTGWYKWCDRLAAEDIIDQDTADLLKPLAEQKFPWGGLSMLLIMLQVKMHKIKSIMDITDLDRQWDLQAQATPNPAPIDNLVRSMIIDPARATENRAQLKKYGFDEQQIDNVILSYYRTIDENTLRTCYLRGIITETRLYERMRELGYTDQRTKEITQTWKLLPPPADLFTMVAHEAFEPDIYNLIGLNEEFPTEQLQWLEEQGISEAWARKYWIAHWEQPSIGQGFEMLHRGVIGLDELDILFKAVEIPRYWRDKLTAIAYQPYTRVDTRRMHELGVLSDEELVKSYMDQGYDPDKALKMAEFTVRYNANTEKDVTRSTILKSYHESLISRTQARDLLLAQDYSEDVADYYLELEDYNRESEIRDNEIANLRERVLLNIVSIADARGKLNAMGLRGDKIDSLLDSWELDRYSYTTLPTKSELNAFLDQGIITPEQWTAYMSRHGYSEQTIGWYYQELTGEQPQKEKLPSRASLDTWIKQGLITENYYREVMLALGYSNELAQLYLTVALAGVPVEEVEEGKVPTRANLDSWLQQGIITDDYYKSAMRSLGYEDSLIELYMTSAKEGITVVETKQERLPSRTDLDGFFKNGLIGESEYKETMAKLGYGNHHIDLYYQKLTASESTSETSEA